jgi:Cu2+-exporting ATPase
MPSSAHFELLDDPQEWSAFSRLIDAGAGLWESQVVVGGMHCAACSVTVEDALRQVPGVQTALVSASGQRATVQWRAGAVLPSRWMQAVIGSGYQVLPANDAFAASQRKIENRAALWRWLVAGLCMMQVMMYAYPAYTARPGDLSAEMEALLRWASWVLTLPVVFFSCGGFFRSAWMDVVQRRVGMDLPVALGIAVTFAVSTAGTFEPAGTFGREVYFDSLTMFVFFLLSGRWLELRLRARTAGALEAVMNRLPEGAERQLADGSFERVAVRRIAVGDLLRVQSGESFAADGVVEQGVSSVDEALLTGESRPLPRGVGAQVLAGSFNLGSTLWVRVQRVANDTRFAQIVALMEAASSTKPQLALLVDRLAKPFLVGVLLSAAGAALWWWDSDPERALMVAVSVLVVTCPCALSLATPAAMLAAAGRLAGGGILVRRLQALEALAQVDTVVFDKTGTLSRDRLWVQGLQTRAGVSQAQALAWAGALACHSLHPASRALVEAGAQEGDGTGWTCASVVEVPGQGLSGQLQPQDSETPPGAATEVLASGSMSGTGGLTRDLRLGSAAFCGLPGAADADTEVMLCDAQGWIATFSLAEALRSDAQACVDALKAAGLGVQVLSGDGQRAVNRVAQALGIADARGGCSPDDKLQALRALQAQGHSVAMVGDGLNDAPVLAGAQVSFALGQAVPLAQARSDFVVLGAQLLPVAHTVLLARRTMAVVRQNLAWALVYNAVCVPLAVAGMLPAWAAGLGMAASSLLVVGNALRLSRPASGAVTPNAVLAT